MRKGTCDTNVKLLMLHRTKYVWVVLMRMEGGVRPSSKYCRTNGGLWYTPRQAKATCGCELPPRARPKENVVSATLSCRYRCSKALVSLRPCYSHACAVQTATMVQIRSLIAKPRALARRPRWRTGMYVASVGTLAFQAFGNSGAHFPTPGSGRCGSCIIARDSCY